ncbi:helix-turn-helix domain-containing protein [Micromonospora sp. NBS 11-29]|uniref:helix-turn-helix domain-containing protein n=1 Tax=Micromonospora sp. NBS 11-29 TaxID=1960879 RepID=UPI0015936018|nr:AraC family transcriptional regulator [Micromonospora sp. NBS 11-29]
MRGDLGGALPLAELARTALFSPFHFHRIFRTVTGETPARFLAALRMAQARRLLLHSRLTVGAISARVGYTSVGSFTTQFTRLVGVPPEQFRRQVRALVGWLIQPAVRPRPLGRGPGVVLHPVVRGGLAATAGTVLVSVVPAAAEPEASHWSAAAGLGPVRLPAGLPPGRYRAQMLLLKSRWTATAALVDQIPDSYLVGWAEFVVPNPPLRPDRVAMRLRPPQPTDPPVLSVEPVRLVAGLRRATPSDLLPVSA